MLYLLFADSALLGTIFKTTWASIIPTPKANATVRLRSTNSLDSSITATNDNHASEMTLTNHINTVPLPKLNGPGLNCTSGWFMKISFIAMGITYEESKAMVHKLKIALSATVEANFKRPIKIETMMTDPTA